MLPPSRPRLASSEVEKIIHRHKVIDPVVVVGIRGYYCQSMGDPAKNDRGIYDDAIFVWSLSPVCAAFNGNTDPSRFRPGIASLVEGVHRYRRGMHGISRGNPYPAFRPATKGEALPVRRDGETEISDGIAINLHRGGNSTTSSEGCQTIPPVQWDAFYSLLDGEMKRHKVSTFPYILTS
jgi:lysozyme